MDIPTLIVDDQEDVRFLLRLIIDEADQGMFVVAEAASGSEALDQVEEHEPVVVVLDEMMPLMNGVETATRIRDRRPAQVIVLCSAYLDPDVLARARAAGVKACLSKEDVRRLPDLIRSAAGVLRPDAP